MSIDRDLLRKAWPEGYLAMRGVSTVGGWNCCGEWWLPGGGADITVHESMDGFYEAVEEGQLLPNVDPADTATWACLLRDLAEAAGLPTRATIDFSKASPACWGIRVVSPWWGDPPSVVFKGIGTDDPALALVLARIQLREAQ